MERMQEVRDELGVIAQADLLLLDHELEERFGQAFESPPSPWLLAADAYPEVQRTAELEKTRFLGGIAIRGESRESPTSDRNNETTLMSAIQLAALGDKQALAVIENNVATDVAERLFKAAHQTQIKMRMAGGKMGQAGRNLTDLHGNALEHTILNAEMLRKTKMELRNGLLFEGLHGKGVFDLYDAAVLSPASTAMTSKEKKDYGFYLDTETCSIQYISTEGDDVSLETAFVAGKRTPTSERHDIATIKRLLASRGIEVTTDDATDMIGYVILIPKGEVRGVEDIVKWYDDAAGGDTFYGEAKPRKDYAAHARECEERSEGFTGMVAAITAQLISEAHTFRTAIDANQRLDELSEQFSVKRAVNDTSINEAVFGKEAAMHIQEARFFMQRGEFDRAETSLAMAQATAESGSCPWLKNILNSGGDSNDPSGSRQETGGKEWMHCPYCSAKVFADPCAKKLACWDCTALVVDGKIISKGNGGSNKRRAQHQSVDVKSPEVTIETVAPEPVSMRQQVDAAFQDRGVDSFEVEEQKAQPKAEHAGKLALAGASV